MIRKRAIVAALVAGSVVGALFAASPASAATYCTSTTGAQACYNTSGKYMTVTDTASDGASARAEIKIWILRSTGDYVFYDTAWCTVSSGYGTSKTCYVGASTNQIRWVTYWANLSANTRGPNSAEKTVYVP